MVSAMQLIDALAIYHPASPYAGFDPSPYPDDRQGWASHNLLFRAVFEAERPAAVIEVGSWKGASAIHMADLMQELGIPGLVVCVDTWLGGIDHLVNSGWRAQLSLEHGYPTLYRQFLANVIRSGHQERILPLPQTSGNAARFLAEAQVSADLVYIDASHEEEDVLADILAYWPLLRPGGTMIGDDLILAYPGVGRALVRAAEQFGVRAQGFQEKWILRKPA